MSIKQHKQTRTENKQCIEWALRINNQMCVCVGVCVCVIKGVLAIKTKAKYDGQLRMRMPLYKTCFICLRLC